MAYYSFEVIAPQPIGIPKPMVLLDAGKNVFNAVVEDLEGLLEIFKVEGIEVVQMNRLDVFETNDPTSILLDGESPIALGPGIPES